MKFVFSTDFYAVIYGDTVFNSNLLILALKIHFSVTKKEDNINENVNQL